MEQTHITLAHGNGGRLMHQLVEKLFARHLGGTHLDVESDAARLPPLEGPIRVTTDGFTVQPLEFPGGDIGALAVHGTVNDLAVSGARPLYLTLNAFIEEGLPLTLLERLVVSMASAAREAGVQVVAGDTKVVPRGEGSGVYFATTGIGVEQRREPLEMQAIRPGDRVLVSGPVGDHGTAVLLAREQFGLKGDLRSDAASVLPLTRALLDLPGLRFMRDPTRGGLASVTHEIAKATGHNLRLLEGQIPIRDPVRTVCELLGYDPLYLACEGRVVAVVANTEAAEALERWQALDAGRQAAVIGTVEGHSGTVVLETTLGGERLLDELEEDPLPRIC